MKTIKSRALAALLVVVALAALTGMSQVNDITLTAAQAGSTIYYFDKTQEGITTTAANRREYHNLSVLNAATNIIAIRIYHKAAPDFDGTFSEIYGQDIQTFSLLPGESIELLGDVIYGFRLNTTPAAGGAVMLLAWD